jgi:hypothetical protein
VRGLIKLIAMRTVVVNCTKLERSLSQGKIVYRIVSEDDTFCITPLSTVEAKVDQMEKAIVAQGAQ